MYAIRSYYGIGADDTGTGEAGTLPVLAGWLPAALAPDAVPELAGDAALTGYVRGGEGSAPPPGEPDVDGAFWIGSMSTAVLAQQWPAPLYSYMVVADEPAQGWNALVITSYSIHYTKLYDRCGSPSRAPRAG